MPTHVALIYGGQSPEHEVSRVSARTVYEALRSSSYRITRVRIERNGNWHLADSGAQVALLPGGRLMGVDGTFSDEMDVAFPILHGANGEDGTIQGLLQLYGVPYVGAGVLGSATGLDKDVSKRLLRDAGLPILPYCVLYREDRNCWDYLRLRALLGPVLFVKPANTGSSVGISRVDGAAQYDAALELAFGYDQKVVIERGIEAREIECALLGSDPMKASVCGEITTTHAFYNYEAKYEDAAATRLHVPAAIDEEAAARIQSLAIRACTALGCEGMARADFFLDAEGNLYINEINTIPGFTSASMYPLLWSHSGLSNDALVAALIEHALERSRRAQLMRMSR